MRGKIGGKKISRDKNKFVNPSSMIYGAFVTLLAHEIAHLDLKESDNTINSWRSLEDWISHFENLKNRQEEERAD